MYTQTNTGKIKMRKVTHIEGRRWFQRTYGNTYHSATIFYDDGTSEKTGVRYGYGDHVLHTAIEFAGLAKSACDVAPYTLFLRENKIAYSIVDVERKKDL